MHEAQRLTQASDSVGEASREKSVLPEVGWPALFQAEILREWNQLDACAGSCIRRGHRAMQTEPNRSSSLAHLLCGYAILLRIYLSRGELDAARSASSAV